MKSFVGSLINSINVPNVFITLALLFVVPSFVLPVYLYVVGLNCNSQIEQIGIERARCPSPIISYKSGTPEYNDFLYQYKSLMNNYFSGGKMLLTSGLLILYELLLLATVILVFTGNPVKEIWTAFAAAGLIFIDTIFVVIAFAFPLQALTEMDSTFMLNALVTIPAVVGIGIYLLVFVVFERRQQRFDGLLETLDSELKSVYPEGLPEDIRQVIFKAKSELLRSSNYLRKNFAFTYVVQKIHSNADKSLNEVEDKALEQLSERIDRTSSHIDVALSSAFGSTHLERREVHKVFYKLVREVHHDLLSEHIMKTINPRPEHFR